MSAVVAAVAAHAARIRQQEEEDMTRYEQDLAQWEFKIVRSHSSRFRNPAILRQVVTEERQGEWELLEKFDDGRLRFRRPVSARSQDGTRPQGYDPYRTTYGVGEGVVALWVVGGVLLFFLALFLVLNATGV